MLRLFQPKACSLVFAAAVVMACGSETSPPSASTGGSGGAAISAPSGGAAGSGATTVAGGSGGASAVAGTSSAVAGTSSGGASGGLAGMPSIDTSGEIYDPDSVPRFDIDLPAESVQALGTAPDVYARGTLRYEGETLADIGVRLKGEGSQRTLEEKAAFKLKFDEFVPKQSFHGLRRMTLNNMVEDPAYLAERLAFHFFREIGLPAPRCNHALVYVNGALFGLYANVEAEDKTFLRRWFDSDAGNLYEEGQVDFEPGNEAAFDLETNEEKNDRSDLTALIAAVSSAKPASFLADVGTQLDTEHFLAFTAAEAAVNQWDMYGYTVFYPNNFRIYRDPTSQKFVMLPWGMDMSMKPYRDSGRPHILALELSRQYDNQGASITSGRIFRQCLESPGCRSAYIKVIEDTATLYENAGLEPLAKKYYEQVKTHIAADPRTEYTSTQIQDGYESLLKVIRERPAALRDSVKE